MSLIKDVKKLSIVAILSILVGVIQSFLVPKIISVVHYGQFKEFTLIASYLSILSFGFTDGIYIKYGGKKYKDFEGNSLIGESRFFIFTQFIIFFSILVFGLFNKSYTIIALSLLGFSQNSILLMKNFLKAIGEFKKFSLITNLESTLKLTLLILILLFVKKPSVNLLIFGLVLPYIILVFVFMPKAFKLLFSNNKIKIIDIKSCYSLGLFIMIGNLMNNLFFTIDRWFVLGYFDEVNFAYYSFASSLITLVFVFITYIAYTFYPKLSKNPNDFILLEKIKKNILIFSSFFLSSFFILKIIVEKFLYKYLYALEIIKILFLCIPAMAIILSIYVNLYKASKQTKKYISTVFIMLIIAAVLNFISLLIFKDILYIAVSTTVSYYIWLLYSSRHFKAVKLIFKDYIFIAINLMVLWYISTFDYILIDFIIYLLFVFILNYIFFNEEMKIILGKMKFAKER